MQKYNNRVRDIGVVQRWRKRVQQLKNLKSHVLDIEKNVKIFKMHVSFHRPFYHSAFSTQLPKVGSSKTHQHQTRCSEMNFDVKISIEIHIQQRLRMHHTPGAGN